MKNFWLCFASLIALVGVLTGCGKSDDSKLVIGTQATFPPYEFRAGNEIVGIDIDIMREVAAALGKTLVVEDMPFDSIITAVQTGKIDVAASGITVTEERKARVLFSFPYVKAAQVMIVRQDSAIADGDHLKGRRIGVQHGTTGDTFVTKNIQEPERYADGTMAVAALDAGKLDVVVLDVEPAKVHVAKNPKLKLLPEPLTVEEYALAISRKNPELHQEINEVLAEMKRSGRLDAIKAKYVKP